MVFKRGKRRPSRRGGKRRKVVRRLTASGINRALTSVRSFRGQELGTIVTTASFANLPVRIGPVIGTTTASSFNNTGGQIFFSLAQLKAMWSEAANPAAVPTLMVPDSTYSFETNYSANPIKTYGNWVKAQVRNVSLNPISIDIYDTFFAKDFDNSLLSYNSSIFNFLFSEVYVQYADLMNSADRDSAMKDLAGVTYNNVNAAALGMLLNNDYFSPLIGKGFKEFFTIKKHHQIVLGPGQSYIWKVKGFKPYTFNFREDNSRFYVKDQTYLPIVRTRGELGMSSTGIAGFNTCNLVFKFDYGMKAYKTNALQHQFLGNAFMNNAPATTVILGPSDDALVN